MSLWESFTSLTGIEFTSTSKLRSWIKSLTEDQVIDILQRISSEHLKFFWLNGCKITNRVLMILKKVCTENEDHRSELSVYPVFADPPWSILNLKIARFALAFHMLKTIPSRQGAFELILLDKLVGSKFDPFIFIIENSEAEVFQWLWDKQPRDAKKSAYIEVALEFQREDIVKLLSR